jgi:hypothetical protein
LAFHGRPRHTGDLDIWIKPSLDNALKMVEVIDEFGFGSLGLSALDFTKENYVTQLGHPPLRIDILNSISGVNFEKAYKNKVKGKFEEVQTWFINVQDFIENKKASGRKRISGILNGSTIRIKVLSRLKKCRLLRSQTTHISGCTTVKISSFFLERTGRRTSKGAG